LYFKEKKMDNKSYVFIESPFKTSLEAAVEQIKKSSNKRDKQESKDAIENALYFAVQKRMMVREYKSDDEYLAGLLSDISEAQNEFEQVCYQNSLSDEVFLTLKSNVLTLLVS